MGKFAEQENEQKKKAQSAPPPQQQTVQRDLSDVNGPEGGMLPGDVSAKIQSMRGSGQKLSDKQNQFYSQKFGRDMSDVHVHTDAASDTVSRSLNARAFTIGSDVFLSKGINPESSSGRDAQTMTHELTHVVQQGGQASSGPLKLGAADTAQEHEAESTAQREFDPKLKEEDDSVQRLYALSNTIQRGFWSDLGSAIAGKALNAIGLGDAMGDFMAGDGKVKAAIQKMPQDRKNQYDQIEQDIKDCEAGIPTKEKEIKSLQKRLEKAEPGQRGAIQTEIDTKNRELNDAPNGLKPKLQDSLNKQLTELQKVDATITNDDVNRYRSGKVKTIFSSIFSAIGGKVLGSFESDPEKKAAAQAKGRNSINNWFASKNKQSSDIDQSEDVQARKAEEIKDKQKTLIEDMWTQVQADPLLSTKYTKLLFKREIAANHMTMIQESLKENESVEDIKSSVMMLLRNKAQSAAQNNGPQVQQQQA